jgi:hypothetical protein
MLWNEPHHFIGHEIMVWKNQGMSRSVAANFEVTAYLELAPAEYQILVTSKLHTITLKLLVIL